MASSWRTIDVDQYDPNVYTEDEILKDFGAEISPAEAESAAQTRYNDVRQLIMRGDVKGALVRALQDPPYGRHLAEAKLTSIQAANDVLCAFKSTDDIQDAVRGLEPDQQCVLMKYLYAGMAKPERFSSSVLLTWHEKLVDVVGTGGIVRVMTDRLSVF